MAATPDQIDQQRDGAIRDRRAQLAGQLDQGRLAFADLEQQRDGAIRSLAELQRHLDGLAGAIQELDRLISQSEPAAAPDRAAAERAACSTYSDPSSLFARLAAGDAP